LRIQFCAGKSARADQTGCSAAFGLLKITLHATKQEDLQGSSRPNGLFGGFWSAENYFVYNKTGVFTRFKQIKRAAQLLLVCRKLLCTQQNRRIYSIQADQMGYFPAFGLLLNKNAPEARRSAHKKNAPLARSRANFSRFR